MVCCRTVSDLTLSQPGARSHFFVLNASEIVTGFDTLEYTGVEWDCGPMRFCYGWSYLRHWDKNTKLSRRVDCQSHGWLEREQDGVMLQMQCDRWYRRWVNSHSGQGKSLKSTGPPRPASASSRLMMIAIAASSLLGLLEPGSSVMSPIPMCEWSPVDQSKYYVKSSNTGKSMIKYRPFSKN